VPAFNEVNLSIYRLKNKKYSKTYFWAIHRQHLDDTLQRAIFLLDISGSKFDNVSRGMRILHRSAIIYLQGIS
jgi:hypothetical protein